VILDFVRTTLHRAISTPIGDGFAPLRVPKDLARRLNVTFGQPLCSAEELAARHAAEARLAALRASKGTPAEKPSAVPTKVAAPVMVYFEKDRNPRELDRIEELLNAKSIPYQLLDLTGDESTMAFVTRTANCKDDDLPVVLVAGAAIGSFKALVDADVSGALAKAVYG
jgi:hypothetical protein